MPSSKQRSSTTWLEQDLFPYQGPVPLTDCPLWSTKDFWAFVKSLRPGSPLGIAALPKTDKVAALALASSDAVLIIRRHGDLMNGSPNDRVIFKLVESTLFTQSRRIFAIDGDKLALMLHHDLGVRIGNCVDLLSGSGSERASFSAWIDALGGRQNVNSDAVRQMLKAQNKVKIADVALQAWAAVFAGQLPSMQANVKTIQRINTIPFESEHLDMLWRNMYDQQRRNALKPVRVQNEITSATVGKKGHLQVISKRFKTRVMTLKSAQHIEITRTVEDREITVRGKATKIDGRHATIDCANAFHTRGTLAVKLTTVGRDPGTCAERARAEIVHHALRRHPAYALFANPLFCLVYLPNSSSASSWASAAPQTAPADPVFTARPLNRSQVGAFKRILSLADEDRVCLVQGPPGTGKTTVIAAAVQGITAASRARTVWLVAQSNVAVKNMAEKLADVGFWEFRILVSKDFHYDWHEHLYQQIEHRVIRSDKFPEERIEAERMVQGARVMLCTLSCLSVARIVCITDVVPLQTVLVDEASQIEVGDFVPMLHQYRKTLQKVVFIGDDKQLPPYGSEDIKGLRSIFEMPHLHGRAAFLDTQYRMPTYLGNFISKNVYKGRLKSEHAIRAASCIRFINVVHGQEKSVGTSWTNEREVAKVVSLVREYMREGKSFRIITPYDPQRGAIEAALKHADLKWEDTVFNVDSFQGNECDHIIVSLVRSGVKLGFLALQRRVNVMLTRCKKSMTIVTKRAFLEGAGSSSLVGKLAQACGPDAWTDA